MVQHTRLTWHGDHASGAVDEAAVRGLRLASEHLLGASRQQVPHEEGTLERSGVAQVDESDRRAAVSYDTPYAVRQHEELTYRHDPGRKAKYLEDPLNEERPTMLEMIAAEIRRALQ